MEGGLRTRSQQLVYVAAAAVLFAFAVFLIPFSVEAADPWPATSSTEIGQDLSSGDEPSGIVWHKRLQQLVLVGDDGNLDLMNLDGTITDSWWPGGDLEAVAIPDHNESTVLLGREASGTIVEFDLETGSLTGTSWDVNTWVPAGSGSGLEAMTFIPNGYHDYGTIDFGGVVEVGWQNNGDRFVFDLSSSTPVLLDQYVSESWLRDIAGLHFETTTGLTTAVYAGYRLVRVYDGETLVEEYSVPGGDVEAITVVPDSDGAGSGTAQVVTGDDKSVEVWVYGGFPVEYIAANELFVESTETTYTTEESSSVETTQETEVETVTSAVENSDGSTTTTVTEVTTVRTYETTTVTTTITPITTTTYTDGSISEETGEPEVTTEVGEQVLVDETSTSQVISEETTVVAVSEETVIESTQTTEDEVTTAESTDTVVTKTDNGDGTITVRVSELTTVATTTVTTTTTVETPVTTTVYSDGSTEVTTGESTTTVTVGEPVESVSAEGTILGEHTFDGLSDDLPCNEYQTSYHGWSYNLSSDCMRVISTNGRIIHIHDFEGKLLSYRKFYKKVPADFDLAVVDMYEDGVDEIIIANIPPKRARGRVAVAQLHEDSSLYKTGHKRVSAGADRTPTIKSVNAETGDVEVLFGSAVRNYVVHANGRIGLRK